MVQHSEEFHGESWLAIESQEDLLRSMANLLEGVSTVDRSVRENACKKEFKFAARGVDGVERATRGRNGEEGRAGS